MPELPEVETIVRTLAPQIEGQTIAKVDILFPSSVDSELDLKLLENSLITKVRRRAKLILIDLSNGLCLAFHLKMTGALLVYSIEKAPEAHDRIFFYLTNQSKLVFKDIRRFGYAKLLNNNSFNSWKFWTNLGPEPLELNTENFVALFKKKNAKIKSELLDQTVICGIGNIYADEALFNSGIMPDRLVKNISTQEFKILLEEIQKVLKLSIEQCGSSIRDYKDANGNAGAFQNSFNVYGKKDQECKKCNGTIEAKKVAGRTSSYCKNCQK